MFVKINMMKENKNIKFFRNEKNAFSRMTKKKFD